MKLDGKRERSAYILMERVWPVEIENYPVRPAGEVRRCRMVSELGIFGTLIGYAVNPLLFCMCTLAKFVQNL